MSLRGITSKGSRVRAVVARILVVAFALHAAIPLGFMPDLKSLNDGRIDIVICTGAGFKTIEIDANGNPVEPDSPDTVSPACPFALSIAKAIVPEHTGEAEVVAIGHADRLRPADDFVRITVLQGPPLGSRAPPIQQI